MESLQQFLQMANYMGGRLTAPLLMIVIVSLAVLYFARFRAAALILGALVVMSAIIAFFGFFGGIFDYYVIGGLKQSIIGPDLPLGPVKAAHTITAMAITLIVFCILGAKAVSDGHLSTREITQLAWVALIGALSGAAITGSLITFVYVLGACLIAGLFYSTWQHGYKPASVYLRRSWESRGAGEAEFENTGSPNYIRMGSIAALIVLLLIVGGWAYTSGTISFSRNVAYTDTLRTNELRTKFASITGNVTPKKIIDGTSVQTAMNMGTATPTKAKQQCSCVVVEEVNTEDLWEYRTSRLTGCQTFRVPYADIPDKYNRPCK